MRSMQGMRELGEDPGRVTRLCRVGSLAFSLLDVNVNAVSARGEIQLSVSVSFFTP